jgi:hypothetical protein
VHLVKIHGLLRTFFHNRMDSLLALFIRREEAKTNPYFITFHLSISVSNSLGWALVWFIAVLVQA